MPPPPEWRQQLDRWLDRLRYRYCASHGCPPTLPRGSDVLWSGPGANSACKPTTLTVTASAIHCQCQSCRSLTTRPAPRPCPSTWRQSIGGKTPGATCSCSFCSMRQVGTGICAWRHASLVTVLRRGVWLSLLPADSRPSTCLTVHGAIDFWIARSPVGSPAVFITGAWVEASFIRNLDETVPPLPQVWPKPPVCSPRLPRPRLLAPRMHLRPPAVCVHCCRWLRDALHRYSIVTGDWAAGAGLALSLLCVSSGARVCSSYSGMPKALAAAAACTTARHVCRRASLPPCQSTSQALCAGSSCRRTMPASHPSCLPS